MKESVSNIIMSVVDTVMGLVIIFSILAFAIFGLFWGAIKSLTRKDKKYEDKICSSDHGN